MFISQEAQDGKPSGTFTGRLTPVQAVEPGGYPQAAIELDNAVDDLQESVTSLMQKMEANGLLCDTPSTEAGQPEKEPHLSSPLARSLAARAGRVRYISEQLHTLRRSLDF